MRIIKFIKLFGTGDRTSYPRLIKHYYEHRFFIDFLIKVEGVTIDKRIVTATNTVKNYIYPKLF